MAWQARLQGQPQVRIAKIKNLSRAKRFSFFCYPHPQLPAKPRAGARAGPLGEDSKKKKLLGPDIRHEVGGLESKTKQKPCVFL